MGRFQHGKITVSSEFISHSVQSLLVEEAGHIINDEQHYIGQEGASDSETGPFAIAVLGGGGHDLFEITETRTRESESRKYGEDVARLHGPLNTEIVPQRASKQLAIGLDPTNRSSSNGRSTAEWCSESDQGA